MSDRKIRRYWTLDLTQAGKVKALGPIPAKAQRQHIAVFEGREGDVERFSYWMTFPDDESDPETPPTQAQYDAIVAFYGEGPTTRSQAGHLLSSWYFADQTRSAHNFKFTAARRDLIHVATAAYLLSHPELRAKVNGWSQFRWRNPGEAVEIHRVTAYKPAMRFANDLIADMRADGAAIFG